MHNKVVSKETLVHVRSIEMPVLDRLAYISVCVCMTEIRLQSSPTTTALSKCCIIYLHSFFIMHFAIRSVYLPFYIHVELTSPHSEVDSGDRLRPADGLVPVTIEAPYGLLPQHSVVLRIGYRQIPTWRFV